MITNKPRICFYCADQNPHRDRSLGITNYTYGLLRNLERGGKVDLKAVVSKSSSGVPDTIPRSVIPFRTDHIPGRLLADHFHALIVGQAGEAEFWHYPKGFLPFGPQVRSPKVGTIADTILQFYADNYPQYQSKLSCSYWIAMLKNSIRHFDIVLTVSEFSKRSILEFCSRYALKTPPIFVTYQGVDVREIDEGERPNDPEYILHLAAKQPHKKTNWLLREWQRLQSTGISLPKLLLIGRLDDEGSRTVASLKNVALSGPKTRKEIIQAIKMSLALILPSEIEGFGLPALEAYYSGTPISYVKGTAVEEILGVDSPGGFTFEDGSLFEGLSQVLSMEAAEIDLKRTELQKRFAWSKCVDRTLQAYRSVSPS